MIGLEAILGHTTPWVLAAFRLAGLFIAAPMLAGRSIPGRVKALVAMSLAAAVYPSLPTLAQTAPDVTLLELPVLVVSEAAIGASIGLVAIIPITAVELAGMIIGNQMGLGLARFYNPDTDTDAEAIGQILVFSSMAIFVSLGGLESMFLAVLGTFERLPAGGMAIADAPLELVLGVLGSGFELAFRVALPVLGIILLLLLGLGVLGKTIPQLQVMTVGFAIKIMSGVLVLAWSVSAFGDAVAVEVADVLDQIQAWAGSLGR